MQVILSGIECLRQHIKQMNEHPGSYRPSRCPSCGKAGLWYHGRYLRFPGRSPNDHHLNPISIPRFICPECSKTCSVLPECMPARRWYLWAVQHLVLSSILAGRSIRFVSRQSVLARSTVRRWRRWLDDCFVACASGLRSRFAEFGRYQTVELFWLAVWRVMSLAKAMLYCHQYGITVP